MTRQVHEGNLYFIASVHGAEVILHFYFVFDLLAQPAESDTFDSCCAISRPLIQ